MKFRSAQVNVDAAGTAEQIVTATTLVRSVILKALAANTGLIYVGNDGAGDVTSANGFVLDKGEVIMVKADEAAKGGDSRFDLSTLWVDADTAGDDLCALWIATE